MSKDTRSSQVFLILQQTSRTGHLGTTAKNVIPITASGQMYALPCTEMLARTNGDHNVGEPGCLDALGATNDY